MRILLFGASSDDDSLGEPFGNTLKQIQADLSSWLGESVQAKYAGAYPSPTLGHHVARTLDAVDPDVVLLHCSGWHIGPSTLYGGVKALLGHRLSPGNLNAGFYGVRHTVRCIFDLEAMTTVRRPFGLR